MSFSVPELEDAEVIFDIGYNAPVSHPLVARHIVRAKKKGCKIICVDPRLTETGRIATIYLPIKGGTNMLFLNAMAHVMVTEDLVDHDFIEKHTTGFADYAKEVAQDKYAPEAVAAATHLDPDDIRRAARLFASSKHTMTLWGMGITQFSQGVECVIACSNLSLMTGNYGHYATGVGPVRGQNNVQGTCDMGVLPNQYPGYQDVTDDEIRHKFEKAWGVSLPSHVGLPLTYVPDKVLREPDPKKRIHAYYIIGEDPAQSDPDLPEIRRTLSAIDLVIVQDIFFNKTCEYADVIFPATAWGEHNAVYTSCDRRFQRVRSSSNPSRAARRTGKSSASWQRPWAIPCITTIPSRFGMKCVPCARNSLVPAMKRWSRTTASNGPARKTARMIRGHNISTKVPISLRPTAKAISTTIPGRRPKNWKVPNIPCPCLQSAKSAITPSVL